MLLIKQIHQFLVNPVKQKHSLSQAILVPLPCYMQMLFSQRKVSSNIAFMAARNYVQQDQVTALNLILDIFHLYHACPPQLSLVDVSRQGLFSI